MSHKTKQVMPALAALGIATTLGLALLPGQDFLGTQIPVVDAICTNFLRGGGHQTVGDLAGPAGAASPGAARLGALTEQVTALLGDGPQANASPGGSRSGTALNTANLGLIDQYIFSGLQSAGIQPADPTTDWEFIRRATLDLTGRIPTPARVLSFVADTTPNNSAQPGSPGM